MPNKPTIIECPNNCKFILRPVDHSKTKHYQMLAKVSSLTASLLTFTSRKHRATTNTSAEPLHSAFSKRTNVVTKVKDILSTSAENTIKAVNSKKNKPMHLLFKGTKGRPPLMNIGQMLDPRTNLGDPPKDLMEEWAQYHCLCYPFWDQY